MSKKADKEVFEKLTKYREMREALISGIITESTLKKYDLLSDTKVYMIYWEDYIKEYNKKYDRNLSKYITIQDLIKPRNIIQILYKSTILHYIETKQTCFYCDTETASNMDKHIMYSALNECLNFEYGSHEMKVLEKYCQRTKRKLPQAKFLNSEERQFISCNEIYAKWAVTYFIEESFSFINYMQSLGHPVRIDTLAVTNNIKKAFEFENDSYLVKVNEDGCNNRVMVRSQYIMLLAIRDVIPLLMEQDAIRLYTGLGGTGKSYDALCYAKNISKEWTCVTLSNTVALKLSVDAKQKGFSCIPQSITSYNYGTLQKKTQKKLKFIIIDEFSQWSLNELDTLFNILMEVFKSHGHLILLGDMHQIPSFLGRGNLLYPVQQYLENTKFHIHKSEIVRQQDVKFKDCIMNYVNTGNINSFDRYRINNIEDHVDPMSTMFITGSKYHVEKLNLWALSCILKENDIPYTPLIVTEKTKTQIIYRYGKKELTNKNWKELNNIKLEILESCIERGVYIKVISKETWITNKEAYAIAKGLKMFDYKVLTNDKGEVISFNYDMITIKLNRTNSQGKQIYLDVPTADFFDKFDFGYAITVNRSQGLDWDSVVVHLDFKRRPGCDSNAKNYEAFYVAATRGKLNTAFYIECDDETLSLEPQIVANHFIIEEVKNT